MNILHGQLNFYVVAFLAVWKRVAGRKDRGDRDQDGASTVRNSRKQSRKEGETPNLTLSTFSCKSSGEELLCCFSATSTWSNSAKALPSHLP